MALVQYGPAILTGLDADRPAAASPGRLFVSTDGQSIEYDDGSAWTAVAAANIAAVATDGASILVTLENSQANSAASTNETAELRFGFGGDTDVARIVVGKENDYTTGALSDSFMEIYTDLNGTASRVLRMTSAGHVRIGAVEPSTTTKMFNVVEPSADVYVESTGANDAKYYAAITDTSDRSWAWGMDVSVSDQFSIAFAATLTTSLTSDSMLTISTAGVVNIPGSITFAMGAGTGIAQSSGVANVNTTAVGNVTGGEDDLMTYTLPADSLDADGKSVRITAWGTTAANGNTKTIKLHFGGTVARQIGPTAQNNQDWKIDAVIVRTGATAQDAIGTEMVDNSSVFLTHSHPAEDTTAAIVIKVTGESASSATNDIVQEGMLIEYLN